MIGYLNINSLRNKIADLRIILQSLPLDYLVLSNTKLDKYGAEEIKMVVVLLRLLGGELFVKELVTLNYFFRKTFALNLQYQNRRKNVPTGT